MCKRAQMEMVKCVYCSRIDYLLHTGEMGKRAIAEGMGVKLFTGEKIEGDEIVAVCEQIIEDEDFTYSKLQKSDNHVSKYIQP